MKYRFIISLLLATSAMANPVRTFTDQSGRTVSAEIVKYDSSTGKVQLKRNGGKPIWVSPSAFSSKDQLYIQSWIDGSKFLDPHNFNISIEEEKTSWASSGDDRGNRRERSAHYTITLQNNNSVALEHIRLEYCIFRDRNLNGEKFVESDIREEKIGSIPANSKKTVRSSTGLSFKANNFLNEVVGICVRIHTESANKSSLTREQHFPEGLNKEVYAWKKGEIESSGHQQVNVQNDSPVDFSSVNMSKEDVKTLIETYADAWEEKDFDQWKSLLSDMHPNHKYFDEKIFKNRSIKSYTIKDLDGLNVKVKVTLENGFDRPEWFYLHESGRIKYTPDLFEHPAAEAIDSIRLLYRRQWASTGINQLKEAGVPLFGYQRNNSESKKQKSIKQIYEWLEDNGRSLDHSEPKVFLAEEHFETLMDRAKSTIGYANFTEG